MKTERSQEKSHSVARHRSVVVMAATLLIAANAVPVLAAPDRVIMAPRVLDRVLIKPDLVRIRPLRSKFSFYKLQPTQLNVSMLSAVGDELKIRAKGEKKGATIAEDGDGARGFFVPGDNAQLSVLPDLSAAKNEALSAEEATNRARDFVKKFNLAPREELQNFKPELSVWSRHDVVKGGEGKTLDVIRSVRLLRQLDGLDVVGPSSILAVNVGSDGVAGFTDTLRPTLKSETKAMLRPQAEVEKEFRVKLAEELRSREKTKADASKPQLVY